MFTFPFYYYDYRNKKAGKTRARTHSHTHAQNSRYFWPHSFLFSYICMLFKWRVPKPIPTQRVQDEKHINYVMCTFPKFYYCDYPNKKAGRTHKHTIRVIPGLNHVYFLMFTRFLNGKCRNPHQHNACKMKKCPAWTAICFLVSVTERVYRGTVHR